MASPGRAETERWLLDRGVPHLIEDYNAEERIWTRARPFLILVLLLQTTLAFNGRFDGVAQGVMFVVALVLLVATLAVFNRISRRRTFDVPREVHVPELAFFVVAPTLISLVVAEEPLWTALGVAVFNVILLAGTYFVVGFGLVPMFAWAATKLFEHLVVLVRLTARTLPVLLVLTVFMFINAEIWQVAFLTARPSFLIVGVAIILAGFSFLWITSAQFVRRIRPPSSWEEACARADGTPVAGMAAPSEPLRTEPLRRGVRLNLRILLVTSVGIQVLLVGLLVGVFYTGIGLVFMTPDVLELWTDSGDQNVLFETTVGEMELALTQSHLRVSALIAALAGLNVAVSALTDEAYRETFTGDLVEEMEQNLAVRALYRTLPAD